MNSIEIHNLTKTYGSFTAVDNISFQVGQGEMLGFLGINGAGKSTTINILSTLLKPDSGSVSVCGAKLGTEDGIIRRKIGIVYQNNCLDEILTVKENLLCRGILHGASRKEAKEKLGELNRIFGLQEILGKKYGTLSGGQKRRCEIAAALMHTPELLFLDEPTTGLDPATRKEVWETIEMLRKSTNMTVFLTTHYMEEAAAADRIIIINRGRIISEGTPQELKERYALDTMRLFCEPEQVEHLAEIAKKHGFSVIKEKDAVICSVHATMDTIPCICEAKPLMTGFEVVQGTMDDVFLNSVKEGEKDNAGIL